MKKRDEGAAFCSICSVSACILQMGYIEQEVDHIAVLDFVILAFRAHQALSLAVAMLPPQASACHRR